MIDLRNVGRITIDRGLRMARTPFDTAVRFLPADQPPWNSVVLLIDRADASVHGAAGDVLHDDGLRQDATRRRAAVTERARAIDLRTQAAHEKAAADEALAADLERTSERRRQVTRAAREEREQIAQQATAGQQQTAAAAEAQARATERTREQRLAVQDKKAKREHLQVLDEKEDALDRESDALVATEEARRLRAAAAAAKATRKGTS